ncbi:hypothetical protein RFI_34615 [Reticulomyxa filosa]|uniref:Uncharacterized protein n=1 Tax=Reticulomyxa filosa TaxID=46433 RepID=X6LMG1_RETFI|nr:hypothetical protein RFI_34615 [Reticulomyxa filosa]|eukprot:ETO02799.1 hypothetical protein RFI_34615 [Reticulomyxa filosa]
MNDFTIAFKSSSLFVDSKTQEEQQHESENEAETSSNSTDHPNHPPSVSSSPILRHWNKILIEETNGKMLDDQFSLDLEENILRKFLSGKYHVTEQRMEEALLGQIITITNYTRIKLAVKQSLVTFCSANPNFTVIWDDKANKKKRKIIVDIRHHDESLLKMQIVGMDLHIWKFFSKRKLAKIYKGIHNKSQSFSDGTSKQIQCCSIIEFNGLLQSLTAK